MNKNYVIVSIGIISALIILFVVISGSTFTAITLDEIIKNKDCNGLMQWEEDHMFDNELDLTSKQISGGTQLAMECTGKALDNMFGNTESPSSDSTNAKVILDDILKTKYCDGITAWVEEHGYGVDLGIESEQLGEAINLKLECETKKIDEFGYLVVSP